MISYNEIGDWIAGVGVPAALCGYMVVRVDNALIQLTAELARLATLLETRLPDTPHQLVAIRPESVNREWPS